MSVNGLPVSGRYLPMDSTITSNGSYTLPQYAFIPHPSLHQLSSPMVQSPTPGGVAYSGYAVVPGAVSRPYPSPWCSGVYGIRAHTIKSRPAGG